MPSESFDATEVGLISAAIAKDIAEASNMIATENFGPALRKALGHARELYRLLLERLALAGQHVIEVLGEELKAMADVLDQLELRMVMGAPPQSYRCASHD